MRAVYDLMVFVVKLKRTRRELSRKSPDVTVDRQANSML